MIAYSDTICDFTELGLPPHDNVYKERTFKYVFIEKTLFEDNPEKQKQSIIKDIYNNFFLRYNE